MNPLEAFFNHQSDGFWSWPLLRRLRPGPQDEIGVGTYLRLLPMVAAVALTLIGLLFVLGAAADAFSSGTLLTHAGGLTLLHNVRAIFRMIGIRVVFLTIFVSSGLLLLTLPFAFFWNRRARRLQREPQSPLTLADVWPPPPSVPGR